MRVPLVLISVLVIGSLAWSQAEPTTRPSTGANPTLQPAEQVLNDMLRSSGPSAKPLKPAKPGPTTDATSGAGAAAPGAASLNVVREGTFLVDRTGRLTRGSDGQNWEFTFDSDARAMGDPPIIILPSLKLMAMEDAASRVSRDLRFRITGMVTEYRGRNYVLLEKVVVVPEVTQQF